LKKKTVRAGIAGSGFAAAFHFEALSRVYSVDVEVAGVYSPTRENRERFAARRSIPCFGSLEELIDACDVLHVCTPPSTHEPITVAALERDVSALVEKPFTGWFGEGGGKGGGHGGTGRGDRAGDAGAFKGNTAPKEPFLQGALDSTRRMLEAEKASRGRILYAENWVYAPAIQKEREIIEKTGAQVLWMHGEEAHSGSHSPVYGIWRYAGGGSLIGKGCHPLTAALYLKRVEGRARGGEPIRPRAVSARTAELTRLEGFVDAGHLRTDYDDVEDFAMIHVVFEDGTLADVFASEIVLGGVHNWIEVCANNHRTVCNINPNTVMQTYNPLEESFNDIYVVEKIETKQGWSNPAPDEGLLTGYPAEMEAFYRAAAFDEPLESDGSLAADTISAVYSGYLSAERGGAELVVTLL